MLLQSPAGLPARSRLSWLSPVARGSLVLGGLLSVAALGGACGDDTSETTTEGLAFDLFPEAYRQAQCEHAVECGFMPDLQQCLQNLLPDAVVVQATAAVAWSDLTYDPLAGQGCVDAIRTASCEATSLYPRELRETCDAVFGNRRGEGDPCFAAIECQGLDAVCEGACGDGCCEGVCKLAGGFVADGEPCDNFNPCQPTSICLFDEMAMAEVCVKRSGPNESCVEGGCVEGYSCDLGTAKCFQQSATGGDCNANLANPCGHIGEYCNAETSKCQPKPGPGEPCAVNPISNIICANYAICVGDTCELLPSPGEECPTGSCLGDTSCNTEIDPPVCNARPPARACVILE
jgi:hypothetical protein